jgi:peptidoglycan/LPS O-acetylase OafA/YrhL
VFRSKVAPLLVLGGSVLVRIIVNAAIPPSQDQSAWVAWCYYFFPSTVMFFMLGHLARVLYRNVRLPTLWAWAALGAAAVLLTIQDGYYGFDNVFFYSTILLFAMSLPAIFEATKDNILCNFLGDLTYPLYLSQGVLIGFIGTKGSFLFAMGERIMTVDPGWDDAHVWMRAACISALMIGVAMMLAIGVHYVVEKPATALARSLLSLVDRGRPVETGVSSKSFATS